MSIKLNDSQYESRRDECASKFTVKNDILRFGNCHRSTFILKEIFISLNQMKCNSTIQSNYNIKVGHQPLFMSPGAYLVCIFHTIIDVTQH